MLPVTTMSKGRPPKLTQRFLALCADGEPRTTAEITALLAHDTKTNVSKFLMDLWEDMRLNPWRRPHYSLTTKKCRPGLQPYIGGPKRVWVLISTTNPNQQAAA